MDGAKIVKFIDNRIYYPICNVKGIYLGYIYSSERFMRLGKQRSGNIKST
jgi:hypothetical protein